MKVFLKRKLGFIVFILAFKFAVAQNNSDTVRFANFRALVDQVTHVFKENHPELSFFKYRLVSRPLNYYDYFKGETTDSVCDFMHYLTLVSNLELSNYDSSEKINYNYLVKVLSTYFYRHATPISLSFVEYSDFKDSTFILHSIGWQNNSFTESSPPGYYPFMKKRLFASSALNQVFFNGPINFTISDSLILSNIPDKIGAIQIDFADGNGYVSVQKGNIYPISYATEGEKIIKVKIESDTSTYYSSFSIIDSTMSGAQNRGGSQNSNQSCSTPITPPDVYPTVITAPAAIPFQGNSTVTGRYSVWFSTCNSSHQIRKPYIISAGFNPGNGLQLIPFQIYYNDLNLNINGQTIVLPVSYGWRGTYYEAYNGGFNKRVDPIATSQCGEGSSNGDLYLDRLRAEGYDVIILMYDVGVDYIENNAQLVKALINKINFEKELHGFHFENVVSGYSAGGVSTRLALAQMEAEFKSGVGLHHHTKTWVSIESENQASNVPLGLQYLINFQADPNNQLGLVLSGLNFLQVGADAINCLAAQIAKSFNNNPCAYELTKFTTVNPTGPTAERVSLMNTFSGIAGNTSNGYPEFVRRVGVAQGSGIPNSSGGPNNVPHSSSIMFDSQLKWDLYGNTTVHTDLCGNQWIEYEPFSIKTTTARWWSSNNPSGNIFDGKSEMDRTWTYLGRTCVKGCICCGCGPFRIDYCECVGPFDWAGAHTIFGEQHVARPSNSIQKDWDDVPASTLSAHLELYGTSLYGFYNSWFAGNSFCNHDANLHSFAPTVSTLDLHDPNTGQPLDNFTSPKAMDLMFNNKIGNIPQPEPNNSFGFPHLKHPTDHYKITPYDAVYAIGTNVGTLGDGITLRPANQYHDLDIQKPTPDFLVRVEVAPLDVFLSDRFVGSTLNSPCSVPGCYTAEFEARNQIIVGTGIYALNGNQNFYTPDGDFGVTNNAKVILHAPDISLLPGTDFGGGEADIFIQNFGCPVNPNYKTSNSFSSFSGGTQSVDAISSGMQIAHGPESKQEYSGTKVFPNPSAGILFVERESEDRVKMTIVDITGQLIHESTLQGSQRYSVDLSELENGAYLLSIGNERFRIFVNK